MSIPSRLSIALKALRQLGVSQVALNGLYRVGLRTGYFKRVENRGIENSEASSSRLLSTPLFSFPAREQVLETIGSDGLRALLAEADEIVAGKVRLFGGEPVELNLVPPGPLAHWTEYETGKSRFPIYQLPNLPTPDPKFTWEPARFGWAFVLGRAFHLSGDEKYPAAFWQYFERFTAANPAYLGPNWTSAQEVGLRLLAYVWAGQVLAGSVHSTPARQSALAGAVATHAVRIPATLVYARAQNNNHLLTEAAALYTAGLALPGHRQSARWQALGRKWLDWCFTRQIDAYGEYVQHSTNYHRLMLQVGLWVRALESSGSAAGKSSAGASVDENLALATHWLLSLLDPESGHVPNLGANDGALIFPLAVADFTDYRPVAQAAARAFLGYSLPAGSWDEMALWFGLPRVKGQLDIPRYPGDHLYASHSWGYLRAVQFKSRPSHADQLHLDLWWRGLNAACDAGTYLYNADPPWDNRLTSTLVHNTVSVDGQEQMTRAGRFLYLDWADASHKRYFETDADYLQRVTARTYAYARLGVRHERTVTVFHDERWRVEDELLNAIVPGRQPSVHVYRLHWLLPDGEWEGETGEERVEIRFKSPHGLVTLAVQAQTGTAHAALHTSLVCAGEYVRGTGAPDPVRGWISPSYGHKVPALSLAIEVESPENVTFTSEFTFPVS